MFKVACVQHCATEDVARNLRKLEALIRTARDNGAELISLPENCGSMYPNFHLTLEHAENEANHRALNFLRELTRKYEIHLHIGSIMVRDDAQQSASAKVANRGFLLAPSGDVLARYDKIHLFDVQLAAGESYRESDYVQAGGKAEVVDLPFASLGLSICYDLRFPHLYRHLARRGAQCLMVPAAFTATTGAAHWHVLLRARAIETGCFVIAAAQCGVRPWGRATYGHSLVVNPWGEIVADGGEEEGVILADIEIENVVQARASIPSLTNDSFTIE